MQASPRTALILHRQDGEYPVLHSKPHVFSGKGQAIDPLRILLIPGPGIAGQHAHKARPLLLIQSRQQGLLTRHLQGLSVNPPVASGRQSA